jgi:YfiH family protein
MWDSRKNVVAAVHAGWRGTLARIAFLAVRYFETQIVSLPDSIHVVMGPAIGRCCYEVGDEVFGAFSAEFPDVWDFFVDGRGGRKQLDLIEANRRQLMEAGVPPSQIFSSDLCTSCENHILYSYRREGRGVGRLYGVIGIVPK